MTREIQKAEPIEVPPKYKTHKYTITTTNLTIQKQISYLIKIITRQI